MLDELGTRQRKYLSFGFRRVEGEDGRTALLVTVQDVTSRIELERDLAASRQQATAELATLVETLSSDRDALSGYLERTENGLLEINRILEEGRVLVKREELSKLLERVARRMHAVHHEALVCVDLEKSG